MAKKIPAEAFYEEYHGHQLEHLRQLVNLRIYRVGLCSPRNQKASGTKSNIGLRSRINSLLVQHAPRNGLRAKDSRRSFVYLAGDSTLDNKHWLFRAGQNFREQPSTSPLTLAQPVGPYSKLLDHVGSRSWWGPALNGYEDLLEPALMMHDVSFWVNSESPGQQTGHFNGWYRI